MNIKALIGIENCVLMVYYCRDKMYRFSIVNTIGKIYTCDNSFPTLSSAKLIGISTVKQFAIERQ